MATRISTLILLATLGVIAYVTALAIAPVLLHWLGQAGSAAARASLTETLWAEFVLALAFQLSLFAIYLGLPGRLQRVIGGGPRQAAINAALIAVLAAALWLTVIYAAGGLAIVTRLFVAVLVATTGALLLGAWLLRARGPMEALGVVLAFATVCIATPAGPDRALAIAGYALSLALAYGLFFLRFSAHASRLWRNVSLVFIVAAAHLVWITGLFLTGTVQAVPVWLAFASAALILGCGISLPIGALLLRSRSVLHDLLYDATGETPPGFQPEVISPTAASRAPNGKRAWIISYTGVSNEPRVLRQCEALLSDGWQVVVCGFDGHSPRPPEWTFVRLPRAEPFSGPTHRLLGMARRLAEFLLLRCGIEGAAHVVHGTTPLWLHTRLQLVRLARRHPELKADLVVSHDWHAADTGYAIAAVYGAKFSVDVHEYAAGQYSYDAHWVARHRPVTVAVQRRYLRRADVVTVVCQGIGELIAKENQLPRLPTVIRSVPFKNVQPFRPTGERIEVLYHGDISQRREIHTAIASLPHWRPEFYLRLRGSGDAAYVAQLKAQIAELGVEDRVVFEAPVPFDQIVPAANTADIGYFSFDGTSPQIRFTLPNKLFEYIMAGLCLCVGDTPEVNRIVSHYGNGRLIDPHSKEAIAAAINSLDRETIDACKKASIAAADELNWPAEKERLLEAYRQIL
jgi:glycogen synthase